MQPFDGTEANADDAPPKYRLSDAPLPKIWTQEVRSSPLDCLVLAQSFGEFWAYYSQSNGILYEEACRKTGKALAQGIFALFDADAAFFQEVQRVMDAHTDLGDVQAIVQTLMAWSDGAQKWPYASQQETRFTLGPFLMALKGCCLNRADCAVRPYLTLFNREMDYSSEILRWKGHLPWKVLHGGNIEYQIERLNQTASVVVVGDICRSQDLMTYALDKESFSRYLVEFVEGTRTIVEANGGIFDKFTGDGFVAYFNEAVSQSQGLDYLVSFLRFIEQQTQFAQRLFSRWVQEIRKVPPGGIGLSIGADKGIISLHHKEGHLIAVGDTLVWATRMASEASASETVVNNALYHALKDQPGVAFTERAAQTKTGEAFLARVLHTED